MKIPAFLLRRLYVKGSLQNTSEGFRFDLKNQLGSGYAKSLLPLILDDEELPLESSFFTVDGKEVPFTTVGDGVTFTLAMNKTTTISVRGKTLEKGLHTVKMSFQVAGLGTMSVDFTDVAADD